MTVVVAVVLVVAAFATYVTWTAARLDRLHARVEAARAALDAQLVRRAAAAQELATYAGTHRLLPDAEASRVHELAHAALDISGQAGDVRLDPGGGAGAGGSSGAGIAGAGTSDAGREAAENDLSRALQSALADRVPSAWAAAEPARLLADLHAAATKVGFARQFHNEAVHDTRVLRFQWVPRLLRLSRHQPLPAYFEIDDSALAPPPARSAALPREG